MSRRSRPAKKEIDGRAVGNVEAGGADFQTLVAQLGARGLGLVELQVGGHHARAAGAKLPGDPQAQALRRAGHDRGRVLEVASNAPTHCGLSKRLGATAEQIPAPSTKPKLYHPPLLWTS